MNDPNSRCLKVNEYFRRRWSGILCILECRPHGRFPGSGRQVKAGRQFFGELLFRRRAALASLDGWSWNGLVADVGEDCWLGRFELRSSANCRCMQGWLSFPDIEAAYRSLHGLLLPDYALIVCEQSLCHFLVSHSRRSSKSCCLCVLFYNCRARNI